ncbi:MAG: EAL domain-containing protein [Pseudomonadota bacterium]
MQSAVVPDRFLAFAFGAGDVLLELDSALRIVSLDGAQALIDPSGHAELIGQDFRTLLDSDAQVDFSPVIALSKRDSFRFGPLSIPIGASTKSKRRFCVFANKVLGNNRIFLTISLESRLISPSAGLVDATKPTEAKEFFDRIETLLEDGAEELSDLQMTIVEADASKAGQTATDAILRSLSKYSAGGTPASEIRPGQFAVLHSNDAQAPDTQTIVSDVENSTGISVNGVTLDPAHSGAPNPALFLHTLRAIVDSGDGLTLEEIGASYQETLGDNIKRAEKFKQVLRSDGFTLAFQPIVSLADRSIHHYEALTRFKSDTGFDNAFETIKFAEQTGVIAEFDTQVIDRVFRELQKAHASNQKLHLAANVSGNSLNNLDFLQQLLRTLSDNSVYSDAFQLEITESFQINDLEGLAEVISDIQSLGYSVCLDDFGAGASGFQYLRTLPVNCVKIDGPYIRDAMEDTRARAFLRAMIGLCRELGIETVAEWIENEDQHECLQDMGADFGQGFLYGPAAALPGIEQGEVFRSPR